MNEKKNIGFALVLFILAIYAPTSANAAPVVLDSTNSWSATIEDGQIGHLGIAGGSPPFCEPLCAGPLTFIGLEIALGPASSAVFPGFTQFGGGVGGRPTCLIDGECGPVTGLPTFTLKVLSSGNLYEGVMTFWGDAGDDFCCDSGTPPIPGNPNFASAAFEINPVPLPAAAWLFISALGGLVVAKRRKT